VGESIGGLDEMRSEQNVQEQIEFMEGIIAKAEGKIPRGPIENAKQAVRGPKGEHRESEYFLGFFYGMGAVQMTLEEDGFLSDPQGAFDYMVPLSLAAAELYLEAVEQERGALVH
jgi:hypothetical protein